LFRLLEEHLQSDLLVLKDQKVIRETLDLKASREFRVKMDHKEYRENLDPEDCREFRD
jgi:hypothetical protein